MYYSKYSQDRVDNKDDSFTAFKGERSWFQKMFKLIEGSFSFFCFLEFLGSSVIMVPNDKTWQGICLFWKEVTTEMNSGVVICQYKWYTQEREP